VVAACADDDRVGATVLIVDDYLLFRRSARQMLEAGGFVVVGEAADGASAISAVRDLHPDVVLLDIQLPDIDGFEVARRVAAEPDAPAVILTSIRDASDYRERLPGTPARGFIAKTELSETRIAALLGSGS
jgi:DNA-binding NarL/FixJ family response regulator